MRSDEQETQVYPGVQKSGGAATVIRGEEHGGVVSPTPAHRADDRQLEAAVPGCGSAGLRERGYQQCRAVTHCRTRADGGQADDGTGNRKKSFQLAGWDAAQKRTVAMTMQADYPVKTICEVLDLPRSSFYHQGSAADETAVRQALLDLAGQYPTYGYRRLTALLKRTGWTVNHKRIQRLMVEMGLQRPLKRRKTRTTDSQHDFPRYPNRVGGLKITRPEQVWVADITYIRLARDFVYLAVIMDVYTRAVRGWHLSRALDRELTLTALRRALVDHVPDIHHSDQGVQYACGDY